MNCNKFFMLYILFQLYFNHIKIFLVLVNKSTDVACSSAFLQFILLGVNVMIVLLIQLSYKYYFNEY